MIIDLIKKTILPTYSFVYRYSIHFGSFLMNDFFGNIPIWKLRKAIYRTRGMKIGEKTTINMKTYVLSPKLITIGKSSHINRGDILDGRGGLSIGDNVSISYNVVIMTGSHKVNSETFEGNFKPIIIKDNAWIGVNATILNGITIGRGAVVAAGAVVTKDIENYDIVAGIPATKIAHRNENINYTCDNTFAKFL